MCKLSVCQEVAFHLFEMAFWFSDLFQFAGNLSHVGHHFQRHHLGCVPCTVVQKHWQHKLNHITIPCLSVHWTRESRQQKRVLRGQRQWEECPRKCRNNWKSWRLAIHLLPRVPTKLHFTFHISYSHLYMKAHFLFNIDVHKKPKNSPKNPIP